MIRLRDFLVPAALAALLAACADTAPAPPPLVEAGAEAMSNPAAASDSETAPPEKNAELPGKVGMNEQGEVSSISLEDFFLLHQSDRTLVFDARPAFFFNSGHIPGAVNLPKIGCDERIQQLDNSIRAALVAGKTIVVYCTSRTCPDARTVAIHLSHFGHDAAIFSAGWKAWNQAGMPTE